LGNNNNNKNKNKIIIAQMSNAYLHTASSWTIATSWKSEENDTNRQKDRKEAGKDRPCEAEKKI